MRVEAIANVKHNGDWYSAGETLELTENEFKALKSVVRKVEEPTPVKAPETPPKASAPTSTKPAAKAGKTKE
ncbi:MAG: hypothetical protein J6N19_03000 [Clostridium sp.]|nr:hypothetical protein [Clostridium sp.]